MSVLEILLASALLTLALGGAALILFGAQDAVRAAPSDFEALAHIALAPVAPTTPEPCASLENVDWAHSNRNDFISTTLGSGGLRITDLQTSGNVLYVSARTSSSGNTLLTFSLSDPSSPSYIGGADNIPSVSSSGLASIAVAGSYIFGASNYGANFSSCSEAANCAQLQVFDAHDPAHPQLIANRKAPGVSGSGGQGAGSTLFYRNGYLYLGLTKTNSGPEFSVYDVGANIGSPANPVWLGGYAIGRTINSIRVSGNAAYLATDDTSRELILLDLSDKTHPQLTASFDAPGNSTFGYGFALTLHDSTLQLGRSYVSNAPEWYVLSPQLAVVHAYDVANSTNPDSVDALESTASKTFLLTNTALMVRDTQTGSSIAQLPLSAPGGVATDRRSALTCTQNVFLFSTPATNPNQDVLSVITPS